MSHDGELGHLPYGSIFEAEKPLVSIAGSLWLASDDLWSRGQLTIQNVKFCKSRRFVNLFRQKKSVVISSLLIKNGEKRILVI